MRLIAILLSGLVLISTLAGCGLKSPLDMGTTSPRNHNQLCNRLKRDIVFYSVDQNHDTAWSSPAKQANILRQYRDNHCDEILNGRADVKASTAESTAFSMTGENAPKRDKIQVRSQ